jgi:hypothetical protein
MKKEAITEVLDGLVGSIKKDQIDLFKKLVDEKCFPNVTSIDEFHLGLVFPFEQFLSGLIRTKISTHKDACFLLIHSSFVENNFEKLIEKIEGRACCADKSRTILSALLRFFKEGIPIQWDYTQKITYHLPEKIFTTHIEIMCFYLALVDLYYGKTDKYLVELKNIMEKAKK